MKKIITLLVILCCSGITYSQTPEEMAAWEASMKPGAQHELLATMDGQWDAKVSMWMAPSQPPMVSKATTKNEMIMGNRYQRSVHTGDMMGMPFHGESVTGYDNIGKKFVSTWVDNMGTGIMYMEGQYDDASKTLTLTGTMADPMTGAQITVKETIVHNTPDQHTFTMYMVQDGKETKTMEILYTRAKK